MTRRPGPLTEPLTELLLRAFGPRQVLAEEIAGVDGIEAAYIFGSWAARYTGLPGRPTADLDVLVVGTPDRDDLDDAAQRATARLAREVKVTIRSPGWWRDGTVLSGRSAGSAVPVTTSSTPRRTPPARPATT